MTPRLPPAALLLTLLCAVRANAAAISCVDSEPALQATLQIAAIDGQDDDIRIVAGAYELASTLHYSSAQAHALTLSGRWNRACTAQDGLGTILDAAGQFRVMFIDMDAVADLVVTDLTIQNGNAFETSGLAIGTMGNLLIERNRVLSNLASYDSAMDASAGGSLTVRNNVLFGNVASGPLGGGAGALHGNGAHAFVTGNTVSGNSAPSGSMGGLTVTGSAHFAVTNNILWANAGSDLFVAASGGSTLIHNDVGVATGAAPDDSSEGNLAVDPLFATASPDLCLASNSPLVNGGVDDPDGGAGARDVSGAPRMQGAHADIGACETDVLLFDGFDHMR